jgi:predicted dehydrogenase
VTAAAALPATRIAAPSEAPALRWGILGPGRIADAFATSLQLHTRQRLVAVGSRDGGRGAAFAQRHGIPAVHDSYDALVGDPDVDVVYVATPNPFHARCALSAIEAGKHVVVEKPFAMTADEAERVADAASARGVFAMEAMWPRFLPGTDVIRRVIEDGLIGDVHAVAADLGEYFPPDPTSRLYDPALGGGALLDLGIYLLSFASFAIGAPERVVAAGSFTHTGVDAQASMVLQGPGERQAHLFTTLEARTPTSAFITGTRGVLEVHTPFYLPPGITVTPHGADRSAAHRAVFGENRPEDALCYEAAEAARMIAAGRSESPLLPVAETVRIMRTMDAVRDLLQAADGR